MLISFRVLEDYKYAWHPILPFGNWSFSDLDGLVQKRFGDSALLEIEFLKRELDKLNVRGVI